MSTPIDEWSPAEAEVIARELVACTLGQRQRAELRLDVAGAMHRISVRLQAQLDGIRAGLAAASRVAAAITTDLAKIRREDIQP